MTIWQIVSKKQVPDEELHLRKESNGERFKKIRDLRTWRLASIDL
jgi:hypothetical protein